MNLSNQPICRVCKFWVGHPNLQDIRQHNAVGECRRHPPMGFPMQTPQGVTTVTVVPVTSRDFWCGDHQIGILDA